MDRITITGMEFFGYHGAYAEENRLGQRFSVDLLLELDLRQAGENDDLTASVDYAEAYEKVREIVEGETCRTIEALAEKIAARMKVAYKGLEHVAVTVHKPSAPVKGIFRDVAVTLER